MLTRDCLFQYYHTVTAVRRTDAFKSPMTKVMDLFRHRSNSAVSEADKRKAVSIFYFSKRFFRLVLAIFFFCGEVCKINLHIHRIISHKMSLRFSFNYFLLGLFLNTFFQPESD